MRAAKVDANQPEIVAALRAVGATVQPLHTVGRGCPDLLVGWRGRNHLIEVKDGSKSPSKRRLRASQVEFAAWWPVHVVESVEQAMAVLRAA